MTARLKKILKMEISRFIVLNARITRGRVRDVPSLRVARRSMTIGNQRPDETATVVPIGRLSSGSCMSLMGVEENPHFG
jgi:hypothetical protein